MATTPNTLSPTEYWMSPDALTIELNALDNPQYLQVSLLAGSVITAYRQDVIDYDASLNYRKWNLQAYNNFFDRTDRAYVYAQLDKGGSTALIIYSYDMLELTETITDESGSSREVYNVYLATISSADNGSGELIMRTWETSFETGELTTDKNKFEEQVGEWARMFRLNSVTDMIEVLKDITSAVIHKLYIGARKILINDVQTSSEADKSIAASDTILPTTKFLKESTEVKFHRKDQTDENPFLQKFLEGIESKSVKTNTLESTKFNTGPFGVGFTLKQNDIGKSYLEVDELYVRLKAYFDSLEIKHLSHVGGRVVLSPASMECNRVEVVRTGFDELYDINGSQLYDVENSPLGVEPLDGELVFRCYFNDSDGEIQIVNEFAVNDLAQCREFNIKEGTSSNVSNQYYWRKVVNVGSNYIDLSITDCDNGSTTPKAGDTIVTVGNTSDKNRQNVVYLSSYDDDAPSIKLYSGINSYSMLNKEVTVISPNVNKNLFTGKVVIKSGSEGFKNFTDAPDMDAINEDIQSAKDAAQSASEAVSAVSGEVGNLGDYINGAFKDGIITQTENNTIATYINIINNAKAKVEASYLKLFTNPYLEEGTEKKNLEVAYGRLTSTTESLLSYIESAIADGEVTDHEKGLVDGVFETYNTRSAEYEDAVEDANLYIQNILKQYSDEASRQAVEAANAAANAASAAEEAKQSITSLDTYLDGAFKDGVISEAEAIAIEKYINQINSAKKEVDATYQVLIVNPYLMDSSALQAAKLTFDSTVDSLIKEINTAISDDKVTEIEKENVDFRFTLFSNAYAVLCTEIENTNKAIQEKIKEISISESVAQSQRVIGQVSAESKNDLAQKMGYADYDQMKASWERGETVINGGVINTKLIEAEAVVSSAVIANAIKTETLNVNDNFIVDQGGNVTIGGNAVIKGDAVFQGRIETTFKSITSSDADVDLTTVPITYKLNNDLNVICGYNAVELPIDMDYASKRVMVVNDVTVYSRTPQYTIIKAAQGQPLYGFEIPEDYRNENRYVNQVSLTTGIMEFVAIPSADGTFVRWFLTNMSSAFHGINYSESQIPELETYFVSANVYPSNSGTVEGTGERVAGTKGILKAVPKGNYVFLNWNDGVTASEREVVWDSNKTYTANFVYGQVRIEGRAEPSGWGSVTGGGTYNIGVPVTLKAISADSSKYIFSQWGDGDKNDYKNITADKSETYVAYFNEYTKPVGNIFNIASETTLLTNFSTYLPPTEALAWLRSVSGGESTVILGSGSLTGKLQKNMHLTLSFTLEISTSNSNVYFIYGLGSQMNGYFDDLGQEPTLTSLTQYTGTVNVDIDLWTARTALSTDGLVIAVSGLSANDTVYIRNINLELFSI